MKQFMLLVLTLGFCIAAGANDEQPAPAKAPFISEEEFEYTQDDGGLISFSEAPEFIGMISRPFGQTPAVRVARLYELKNEKALKADREMCRNHVMALHGMDAPETTTERITDLELFKSRFGQSCEIRISSKAKHSEFREHSYILSVIKGKVYVIAYKSRTKITHKEGADFRKFVKSLK